MAAVELRSRVPLGAERGTRANGHGVDDRSRTLIWACVTDDDQWRECVAEFAMMDCLRSEDWPEVAPGAEAAAGVFGQQERFRSVLEDQIIRADVHDVAEHMRQALELTHPLDTAGHFYGPARRYERQRDAELRAAARQTVAEGHGGPAALARRRARVTWWAARLRPLSCRLFDRFAPAHILACPLPRSHPALAAAFIEALNLRDRDAPVRMVVGCPAAGDLPPTRVWDVAFTPRPLGLDVDDLPHRAWNRWLASDAEQRFARLSADGRRDHEAMWRKTIAERDLGYCEGPFSLEQADGIFGPDHWRGARRFAVWQKGALRVIDNEKEDLENASSNQYDKMRTQRADFPARAASLYSERIGHSVRGWAAEHGTDDVTAFYRVVLTATRAYMCVIIVDPASGRATVWVLWGFTFGKVAAVLYANAVAALGATASRRLLGLVVDNYYDDFDVVPLVALDGRRILGAGPVAQAAVGDLMQGLGYGFSAKKHETVAPRRAFGGVFTDMSDLFVHGVIRVYVSDEHKASIAAMCDDALAGCPPEVAEPIVGKVIWASSWIRARAIRSALQPLFVRARSTSSWPRVNSSLADALELVRDLLPHAPPHVIVLGRLDDPPLLVWSDAMYEEGAALEDGGGFVVVRRRAGSTPVVFVGCGRTSPDVRRHFVPDKRTYIGPLEMLWGHAPYASIPEEFRDQRALHWIDNTSALAGFIKGYAASVDSARIVTAQTAQLVELCCAPYYFYVRSKANVADFPSRFAMRELAEVLCAVGLDGCVVWTGSVMPDIATWRLSARALLRAVGVPRFAFPTLASLRSRWCHLVVSVNTSTSWAADGAVYCGRSRSLGPTRFGNHAPGARVAPGLRGRPLRAEHERCVRAYTVWLADPARAGLRRQVRLELRGRRLACHCCPLPCHAEVLAAWANSDVPVSVLLS